MKPVLYFACVRLSLSVCLQNSTAFCVHTVQYAILVVRIGLRSESCCDGNKKSGNQLIAAMAPGLGYSSMKSKAEHGQVGQ